MGYKLKHPLQFAHLISNRNHIGWWSVAIIASKRLCNGFQVQSLQNGRMVVDEIANIRRKANLSTSHALARQIVSKGRRGECVYGEPVRIEIEGE